MNKQNKNFTQQPIVYVHSSYGTLMKKLSPVNKKEK